MAGALAFGLCFTALAAGTRHPGCRAGGRRGRLPMPAETPAAEAAPSRTGRRLPWMTGLDAEGQPPVTDRPAAKSGVWHHAGSRWQRRRSPGKMTPTDLWDRIGHNWFSINFVWTLVTGFLVMFMQAGFACVETGLCRAKNASHTFAMNLMIYPLGCFAFWAYGFAIGWGNWFAGPVPPG